MSRITINDQRSPKMSSDTLTGHPERRFAADFLAMRKLYQVTCVLQVICIYHVWLDPLTHPNASFRRACKDVTAESDVAPMGAFQGFPSTTPFFWFDSRAKEAVEF